MEPGRRKLHRPAFNRAHAQRKKPGVEAVEMGRDRNAPPRRETAGARAPSLPDKQRAAFNLRASAAFLLAGFAGVVGRPRAIEMWPGLTAASSAGRTCCFLLTPGSGVLVHSC